MYGVLRADDWLTRLDNSYLTAAQKEQVRESAYVTLVSLADWCVRWQWATPDPLGTDLDCAGRRCLGCEVNCTATGRR